MSAALAAVPLGDTPRRPSDALDAKSRLAWQGWDLAKDAKGVQKSTRECYERAVCMLAAAAGVPLDRVTARQIREWLVSMAADGLSASSRSTYLRHVKNFYGWMLAEEYVTASPAAGVELPQVPEHLAVIVSDTYVAALVGSVKGKTWRDKRDRALLRMLFECGPRASEAAGIAIGHLDIGGRHALIREGKWGRDRLVPFSARTGSALHAAMMARPGTMTNDSKLFIGTKSPHAPFTRSGVTSVLKDRCEAAGLEVIGPHAARHFAVAKFFAAGGTERDAMAIFGWKSTIMANHYGKAATNRTALLHFGQLGIGDNF